MVPGQLVVLHEPELAQYLQALRSAVEQSGSTTPQPQSQEPSFQKNLEHVHSGGAQSRFLGYSSDPSKQFFVPSQAFALSMQVLLAHWNWLDVQHSGFNGASSDPSEHC
jgi:hypothetical protein